MREPIQIKLISTTYETDAMGVQREIRAERFVLASMMSVSAQEFFNAGEHGLRADKVFEVWVWEYNEESIIECNGKLYEIYRTYITNEGRIELYCQKRVGV